MLEIGEKAGDVIGHYKLLQPVGEGGFGVVWLAERRDSIVQRVALKVIKPGMDTRSVISRFEQERQALAVMNHPNVAKVFDAGATATGRPYFVMEYVPGEPITGFCDRHALSVRERLQLFLPVCEAVQHAHMKGIIHRDLKPSNVLVSIPDGPLEGALSRAVPKVIDFGVAKAIAHTMSGKTLFTELGQIVGTPEYMSPEQADTRGGDVDTRTDVYALGCVLYELLTGALPFDPHSLRSAGYIEIQRIIREIDPPRPSTRLSSLGELSAEVAKRRKTRPGDLENELRKELEWIPLKAMRKNREERYRTPTDLADDIRNYLSSRPLTAGPESAVYRTKKFVRKHRIGVATGATIGVTLLAATVISTVSLVRERAARKEAAEQRDTAQSVNDFLNDDMLSAADPENGSGTGKGVDTRVVDVLDIATAALDQRFAKSPAVAARVARTLGSAYIAVGRPRQAEDILKKALDLNKGADEDIEIALALNLGESFFRQGHFAEAAALLEPRLKSCESRYGLRDRRSVDLRHMLAGAFKNQGLLDQAEPMYKDVLAIREQDFPDRPIDIVIAHKNLALVPMARGRKLNKEGRESDAAKEFDGALSLFQKVINSSQTRLGPTHPETLAAESEVPKLLFLLKRTAEAQREFDRVIPLLAQTLGPTHWRTLDCRAVEANMLRTLGRHNDAAERLGKLVDDYRYTRGPTFKDTITVTTWLADSCEQLGRFDESERLLVRSANELRASSEADAYRRLACKVAAFLSRRSQTAKAEEYQRDCVP